MPFEIDESGHYFFSSDTRSMIRIYSLTDGTDIGPVFVSEVQSLTHATRRGARWIVVDRRYPPGEEEAEPHDTSITAFELSWPPRNSSKNDSSLEGVSFQQTIQAESTDVYAAITSSHVWVAAPNALYRLNLKLEAEAAWRGPIDPRGLSTDGERVYVLSFDEAITRIHLIAFNARGRLLWKHTCDDWDFRAPPIVGYKNDAYLLTSKKLTHLGPDGSILWERVFSAEALGGAVSMDDKAVVTTLHDVLVFDPAGTPTVIASYPNETIVGAPSMTADGNLLIVTDKALYALHRPLP